MAFTLSRCAPWPCAFISLALWAAPAAMAPALPGKMHIAFKDAQGLPGGTMEVEIAEEKGESCSGRSEKDGQAHRVRVLSTDHLAPRFKPFRHPAAWLGADFIMDLSAPVCDAYVFLRAAPTEHVYRGEVSEAGLGYHRSIGSFEAYWIR